MPTDFSQSRSAITPKGLVNITSKEELIRQKLEEERDRLTREMGVVGRSVRVLREVFAGAFL